MLDMQGVNPMNELFVISEESISHAIDTVADSYTVQLKMEEDDNVSSCSSIQLK